MRWGAALTIFGGFTAAYLTFSIIHRALTTHVVTPGTPTTP